MVGFAVYDTITGLVARHLVPAPAGLGELQMGWFGDAALVVGCDPVTRVDSDSVMHEGGGSHDLPPVIRDGRVDVVAARHLDLKVGLVKTPRAALHVVGFPLGWRDADHLASFDPGSLRVLVVDLRSRVSQGVITSTVALRQGTFASDLWARPVAVRPGPAWAPRPWVGSAFLVLGGIVAVCVVVVVRSRPRDHARSGRLGAGRRDRFLGRRTTRLSRTRRCRR